ncbi:hypothetical protein N9L52_06120 [Litoricolaceae bacterium]|nr:hypothetical protein [Litorivicinaceae bacterium]
MKQTKTYSEYGGGDLELWEYYNRFNKMPDLNHPDWFNTPELLTPDVIKTRIQRMASHLKTAIPLSRLIHWEDTGVSLGLAQQLGWRVRRSQTHSSLNCLLANLYHITTFGQTDVMSISLNSNSYVPTLSANPMGVTGSIRDYVKDMVSSEIALKYTGYNDRTGRKKSRNTALVLSNQFIDGLLEVEVPNVTTPEIEPIRWVIRDETFRDIPQSFIPGILPDEVQKNRNLLLAYNEFIRSYHVTVSRPDQREFHDCIAFHMKYYGEGMDLHSRISGGRYQYMKKDIRRPFLRINGEKTVEIDIAESHPTIVYALAGKPLSEADLGKCYWLSDSEPVSYVRDAVKVGMACMLNSADRVKAESAITHAGNMGEIALQEISSARKLVDKILERHSEVADYFFRPDIGMRCMEAEGKIMLETMHWGMQNDLPVLPLHDAVICRQSDTGKVAKALREASCAVLGKPIKISVKVA